MNGNGLAAASSAKGRLRSLGTLLSKSYDRYDALDGFRLGAAFSYYSTFAIFPLVLLTVSVVGFAIGDDATVRNRILSAVGADSSVRAVLEQTLVAMQQSHGARKTSAVIGLVTLLFSASGVFVELDYTLNKIWKVPPRPTVGIRAKVSSFVSERLSSFVCVAAIGTFMVLSLVVSASLDFIASFLHLTSAPAVVHAVELFATIGLLSLVFTAAFHFVPRSRPPVRDVFAGALLTTVLLTALKALFAIYLSKLTSYSAYGVVGGVLALATWIYLSSQIIFFGATLTRVYCEMRGCPAAREHEEEVRPPAGQGGTLSAREAAAE